MLARDSEPAVPSPLPVQAPAPVAMVTPVAPSRSVPAIANDIDSTDHRSPTLQSVVAPPLYESLNLYIHLPPDAAKHQPLRVLIVLHGMGSRGDAFSQNLLAEADKNYWLVVAPTLPYGDYMDPATLLKEDVRFSAMLDDMLQNLPKKLGIKLRSHALVFGFSRGAQLADRFALFYPNRVEATASISAGTYTLPSEHKNNDASAPLVQMPYGVGDLEKYLGHPLNRVQLAQVSFLLEVGANDTEPDDVPRQFDSYMGKSRLARAYAFQYALSTIGVQAKLSVFPGAAHEVTPDMRVSAIQFLREQEQAKKLND